MANIWKQNKDINNNVKRNNFDLSKKINASFKLGTLYPVYCQPVVPGDSFSIDTAYNLKLQPVVFPVQSKIRAHMHYFYVRNKNLWNNWENWIMNLASQANHPHPYISRPDTEFTSGSIHDFLNVPTSVVFNGSGTSTTPLRGVFGLGLGVSTKYPTLLFKNTATSSIGDGMSGVGINIPDVDPNIGVDPSFVYALGISPTFDADYVFPEYTSLEQYLLTSKTNVLPKLSGFAFDVDLDLSWITACTKAYKNMTGDDYSDETIGLGLLVKGNDGKFYNVTPFYASCNVTTGKGSCNVDFRNDDFQTYAEFSGHICKYLNDNFTSFQDYIENGGEYAFYYKAYYTVEEEDSKKWGNFGHTVGTVTNSTFASIPVVSHASFEQYSDLGLPLYSTHLRINALPYRAYESIYNAYYRNTVVDPFMISGEPQYNRYITNDGDGADSTAYHLFQRNYELDFLTSALPSPQQGVAPLVGMTALGDITIEDENGITTAHAQIDDDGTISKVVLTSPAASIDHARTAMNIAASGMSINDFRNTNALQRLLETTIRKGYKYIDFVPGHFGVTPKDVELDMPEFIGGFSRDVNVSTVVSQADTLGDSSGAALGEYGGYASLAGGSKHSVRHYCDDYGFIIGIMSVVPTPCYSQLLPKHMVAPDNFLDYYFPEMAQISMQPITYKEVCPIQAYIESIEDGGQTSLEDTFGYQRPNYDMVGAVDEVHGDFRGTLKDYVINRQFDGRPELGKDFISINPSEINDIFVDTEPTDDKVIGEIAFAVHAKRPVPRVHIPQLGR